MRPFLSFVTFVVTGACYTYDSVQGPTPLPGTKVSADLTGAGSVQLANQLGPNVAAVRGRVVRADETVMILSLNSVTAQNDEQIFWKGEQVRIPLTTVAQVQQRRFSLGRSLIFGGVAVGAVVAAGAAFSGGGSGVGGIGPGGPGSPQ